MNPVNTFRALLVAVAVSFGGSSFLLSDIIQRAQDAVDRITRHETAWVASNGRHEIARLGEVAAIFRATGAAADHDALALALDIVEGRLRLFEEGGFGALTRSTADRQERVARLREAVEMIGGLLPALPESAAWTSLGVQIETADRLMTRIATDAQAVGLADARRLSEDLTYKQMLQNWLLGGLVISVGLLVGMSEVQNRFLVRARDAANKASREFAHLARHDPLTALPNRMAFGEALAAAQQASAEGGLRYAVFILDLDGFKPINDTLGHGVGDSLLRSVADRLRAAAAEWPGSIISRFGGDEFVVLMPAITDITEAKHRAEQLRDALRTPHHLNGHALLVDVSIGVAISTGKPAKDADLLHHADIALNKAKSQGRAQISLFRPRLLEIVEQYSQLERDLNTALASNQIYPVYQPQIDIASGRVVGVEALARWAHPTRGTIPPGEFIPVAEASGQISEIGLLMLERACADAANRLPEDVGVSVNASAVQIVQHDFPEVVARVLTRSGLAPARLTIEITESAVMRDVRRAERTVRRLRGLGVSISLDDFGTGHSSLSYIRRFGLDELKIDRAFVSNLGASEEDTAIVHTVIQLARTLKLSVVAEGVETAHQLDQLRALGCARAQGFMIGRPEALDKLFPQSVQLGSIERQVFVATQSGAAAPH